MNGEPEFSGDALLATLKNSASYATSQERIGLLLARGLFRLVQARHSVGGSSLTSIEDIRLEIEPTATLASAGPKFSLSRASGDGVVNPILLVSALPPPQLRLARDDFETALKELVELATMAKHLMEVTRSSRN